MPRHTKPNPSAEWPDFYLIVTTHKDAPYLLEGGLQTRAEVIKNIADGQQEGVLCVLKVPRHGDREDVTDEILEAIGDQSRANACEPFDSLAALMDRYNVDYFRARDESPRGTFGFSNHEHSTLNHAQQFGRAR